MMKTIRAGAGISFLLMASLCLKAQNYYYNSRYYEGAVTAEFGGSIGMMNCLTDLGGKKGIGKGFIKDLNGKNSKPSYSIFVMGTWKYALGVRLEATFGSVQAADSVLKSVANTTGGRYERNLSFKSKIADFQLSLEIHPLFFRDYDEDKAPRISPYVVGGVGLFSFDPQAKLNGQWHSLQPLHTEGQGFLEYRQRKPYKLTQINFPVGLGVKYEVSSFLNVRLELVHRILTTDYLDDVSTDYINPDLFPTYLPASLAFFARQLHDRQGELNGSHIPAPESQRGDPKDKDAFFSIQLKLSMALGRQRR